MKRVLVLVAAALALMSACTSPFGNEGNAAVTDISSNLDFMQISRQGFMGGSVLYNPAETSAGQLANNVSVAVRLGSAVAETVETGQIVYSDVQEKAQYGLLVVNKIDAQSVAFTVHLYDVNGAAAGGGSYTLNLNGRLDINGDGVPDLEYKEPAHKRPGLESAVYLTFLSSQEALNTTMFAVLKEQYARSVYPSGIIGINPEGHFIYSKYEAEDGARSVVNGVRRGDYVLDNATGKYQRVTGEPSAAGARSIDDATLTEVAGTEDPTAFLFKSADFSGGLDADTLLATLPASVTGPLAGSTLDKLNALVKTRELIRLIAEASGENVDDAEFDRAMADFPEAEVVKFNRTSLATLYPDKCPPFFNPNSGFVEAVPLASLVIGGGEFSPDEAVDNVSRAVSQSAYASEKSTINSKFAQYTTLFSTTFYVSSTNPYVTLRTPPILKAGIKGSFNNVWGNISGGLAGAVYVSMETDAKFTNSASYSQNLLPPLEYRRNLPVAYYGPVALNVSVYFGLKMPLVASAKTASNLYAYFTGMYGGGADVGINYGVRWVQVWWLVYRPEPYFSPYFSAYQIKNTAYFLDGSTSNTASISITPMVYGGVGMSICGLVGADLGAEAGLQFKMQASCTLPSVYQEGRLYAGGEVAFIPNVHITPWIGCSLPYIGYVGYQRSFNLYSSKTVLRSWTLIDKKVVLYN